MVLRYLVGKTNAEVAQAMQVSESAVEGRLKRAKDQLRLRLARQGITLGAALGALEATRSTAPAAEAAALVENTVSSCLHGHEVGAESTGGVSEEVMQLAKQEIMTMTSSSLAKTVIVGCIAVGIVAVGWGLRQGVLWAQADDSPFATEIQVTTEANNAADLFGATIKAAPPSAQAAAEQSRISGRFDLKHMSAWEKKILAALAEPTSFEFSEQPLAEAILFLEDTHDIEIEIDKPALEDIGIDATSTLISRNLSGISLRSALDLVLRDLRLEAVMHDEVLMITTEEVAETMMEARVYNLEMAAPQLERLVKLIPEVVAPDSWKESGGPGFIGAYGSGLVISQTSRIHDEINELLDQLNRL
jgi:hypothetical protein